MMSSLIQSKSTIDADQLVPVRPVFMWANQCIHQRHAELTDQAAPTFRFSKAPYAGAPIYLHSCMHARTLTYGYTHTHTHTHASTAYLPKTKHSNLMATAKRNLPLKSSKGLHYHTYKSLSMH